MNSKDNNIAGKLTNDDEKVIAKLYNLYRTGFIDFAVNRYLLDNATALDIYQESFIALYENIQSGQLSVLTASLKTYLYAIGRNKIYNYYRERDRLPENNSLEESFCSPDSNDEDWIKKQEIAYDLVQLMNDPCNSVLRLYYWERKSMADIASFMNYKNAQVAKNQKAICIKKLKNVLLNRFKTEGLI